MLALAGIAGETDSLLPLSSAYFLRCAQGHSITALYISSPYLIRTTRFYAQHKPASPLSLGLPISTPPDDAVALDPSREPRDDLGLVPPVVEVDVAQPEGRKYEGVGEGEGVRMREVTVGFVFPDVLLAE